MLEFSFEIIDESKINIVYQYGSSSFNFNLFFKYGVWTLHPFDGILLQNKEMCRLIVAELFKNKDFHVMLARENILLSALRTSIDLNPEIRGERYQEQEPDELSEFAETHSFEEVLQIEQDFIRERMDFFQNIIQKMYMEGFGPEDSDFNKVQAIIRIYKAAHDQLGDLSDFPLRGDERRRW
ncbi:hypothetical protein [Paenibacillus kribbensis]|uniref:Uncharacterized protein n=1 Tax=Paenibacillus kribbensis TaxID=172713 RepID=A0A222WQK4_9BACL|nr:hypothetical protein [Paenibacillus kribbensis]ASR48880.1 hypothetical protein B4V02_20345 [Paenibacillus kribbensis]